MTMGDEADADWQGGLLEWVRTGSEDLITRQEYICRNSPRCHECRSFQVQLLAQHEPAEWRCRQCKHKFTFEP